MIYTIGHTESYERYFREQKQSKKLGRTKDFCGGSVWKLVDEAKKFCPKGYSVYGVKANWKKDTIKSKDGNWNDLLKTSNLVKLKEISRKMTK
jgi:hypothetical protein